MPFDEWQANSDHGRKSLQEDSRNMRRPIAMHARKHLENGKSKAVVMKNL
jgi:hypothetical protein